jgi:N-acetylneuraminic acid mutarotase
MATRSRHDKALTTGIVLLALLGTAVTSGARVVWIPKAAMPTPRAALATCEVDGKIYAIGGGGYVMPTVATVEMYDPATDTWTRKADMPTPRGFLAAAAIGGRIYAIGGFGPGGDNTANTRTVEMYDPATDTWTRKADMSTPRSGLSASVVEGKIYAIGGAGSAWAPLGLVEVYDPATDTWVRKANMPTPRFKVSTCVVDGKIYAIGGRTIYELFGQVEVYDPATDTWIRKAQMPTPRCALGTGVVDGRIYAIGGSYIDTSPDMDGIVNPGPVEVYDPATDTWTPETELPEPRGFLGASVVEGKVFAIGGASFYEPGAMRYTPSVEVLLFDHPELVRSATREQTVYAGQAVQLSLEVTLNGRSADGTYPPLQLDLSPLGIAGRVPFIHEGQGRYAAKPVLTLPDNGQFQLPVWLDEAAQAVLYAFSLTVLPGADLSLFGDGPGSGWTWRPEGTAALDTAATAAIYQGTRALTVQASGAWKAICETALPVSRLGYDSLAVALHPGDGDPPRALEVGLNTHKRRNLLKLVDWAEKRWQQVAIPLDSMGLEPGEAVASVALVGMLKGSLHLDEVRLTATPPPPPPTAVLEEWTGALPSAFSLAQNYPNPFNSDTAISFALTAREEVVLALYNLAGQQVATLAQGVREAGVYTLTWDGKDRHGMALASGVYLYRLQTATQEQTRKLLLLR